MAKQGLAGRRLHLSWVKELKSWVPGRGMVYGCLAGQRDHVQGRVGKSLMHKGCDHLILLCLSPDQGC